MEALTIREESGGTRPYLMNQAVHAGDCLQVFFDGHWLEARCECGREKGNIYWYLIVFQPSGEEIIEDCIGTVWCRWQA